MHFVAEIVGDCSHCSDGYALDDPGSRIGYDAGGSGIDFLLEESEELLPGVAGSERITQPLVIHANLSQTNYIIKIGVQK